MATIPGVPRTLLVTGTAAGELELTWLVPLSNGGSVLTNYKIYASTTSTPILIATVGTTVLTYHHITSRTGDKLYFKVAAVNAEGEGASVSYTWEPIIVQNKDNHLTDSISTFVFTLAGAIGTAGVDAYDLSPYLYGYRVIGGVFGAGAAGDFAYINKTTKKVTVGSANSISFTVFGIRQMEP